MTKSTADQIPMDSLQGRELKFFGHEPVSVSVEVAGISHPGLVRDKNEDHFAVVQRRRMRTILATNLPEELPRESTEDAYAMVVADGMGGHACGEIASLMALCFGWELGGREIKWPHKFGDQEVPEIMEKLETYPRLIQKALRKQIDQEPMLRGMGTTLTGFYSMGWQAFVTHVGDSRAYLYRDGELTRLTRDQTLAEDLAKAGISIDSEYLQRARHILTSCLGDTDAELRPVTAHFELRADDQLLLCTDGLTDLVDDDQIAIVLSENRSAEDVCEHLQNLALANGGRDNVTIISARYRDVTENREVPESVSADAETKTDFRPMRS